MLFGKKRQANCPASLLFEILEDNLRDGLCTDILFLTNGKKHRFGAWGDQGGTRSNVVFYLDEDDYGSKKELEEKAMIEGHRLMDYEGLVTVTECDGCYPESTLKLRAFLQEK